MADFVHNLLQIVLKILCAHKYLKLLTACVAEAILHSLYLYILPTYYYTQVNTSCASHAPYAAGMMPIIQQLLRK